MRLIDADELMIKLQWHCDLNCPYTEKQRDIMCNACFLGDAKDYIDSMPTVDAEPIKHGEWRADEMSYTVGETWCSICKTEYYIDDLYNVGENGQNNLPNYCPHCGARMDGIGKDNETSSSVYESIKQGLEDAINGDVRKSEINNG